MSKKSKLLKKKIFHTIRFRLLVALLFLSASNMIMGSIAWYWLEHSNQNVTALQNKTLTLLNMSIDLVNQSGYLGLSAPYLFNLKTNYLISNESDIIQNKIKNIKLLINGWAVEANDYLELEINKSNLIEDITIYENSLNNVLSITNRQLSEDNVKHLELTNDIKNIIRQNDNNPGDKIDNYALNIIRLLEVSLKASSLINLGEDRRKYQALIRNIDKQNLNSYSLNIISKLQKIVDADEGVFKLRASMLKKKLQLNRYLHLIQDAAKKISSEIFAQTEIIGSKFSARHSDISNKISFAELLIVSNLFLCLLIAGAAIFYIYTNIIGRLNLVTNAMTKLASGVSNVTLPKSDHQHDELSKLTQAFKVFRKNANELSDLSKETKDKTALIESTFANMRDGVFVTNLNGEVLFYNDKLLKLLKIDADSIIEKIDIGSFLILSPQMSDNVISDLINSDSYSFEIASENFAIEIRHSKYSNKSIIWLVSNITERKKIEERLLQFRKLESLGQMTGGIAHDFNNILTAITGNIHLLKGHKHLSDKSKSIIERLQNATDIGASLTERLLAFAKKQNLKPELVNLKELITGMQDLLDFSIGDNNKLVFICKASDPLVKIDPNQLEHALLNLCLNSAQAIADNETLNKNNKEGYVKIIISDANDENFKISIIDNGCGIPENIINSVYEPFFSTRDKKTNSGLGLSIVFGFIQQSGGNINIESTINQSTIVELSLPKYDITKEQNNHTQHASQSVRLADNSLNNKTVLIVEDNDILRKTTKDIFTSLGIQTKAVSNSQSASKHINNNKFQFDILFTDIELNDKSNGWELAIQTLNIRPNTKIITTSAFANASQIPKELIDKIEFLPKPYQKNDIEKSLHINNLNPY